LIKAPCVKSEREGGEMKEWNTKYDTPPGKGGEKKVVFIPHCGGGARNVGVSIKKVRKKIQKKMATVWEHG